jgi:hypothetical protein
MIHKLLFIIAARFYIKYFPNYKNWAVPSEFFVTILFISNFVPLLLLSRFKIDRIILGAIALIIHFGLAFLLNRYGHKSYVLDYKFNNRDRIITTIYFFMTIFLFTTIFW